MALEILEELHDPTAEHTAQLTALGQPDQPVGMLGSSGLQQDLIQFDSIRLDSRNKPCML